MISGLEKVMSRRVWFVPDFAVWGQPNIGLVEYITVEQVGSTTNVMYGVADIGDSPQRVLFSQLTDHRGNQLPATIKAPRVMPRARSAESAFVVETESPTGFRIAHEGSGATPVTVDLLVIEMGE
jgi:hypothetical protein